MSSCLPVRKAKSSARKSGSHAATDRLRPHGLVAPGRELLPMGPGLPLDRALFNEWADARRDLCLFLGPERGLPFAHEIAIGLHPLLGVRLLAPQIKQEHAI